jgi:hypothetical protein
MFGLGFLCVFKWTSFWITKSDLVFINAKNLILCFYFSTNVASDVLGCVSAKCRVLFFDLCFKVLQLLRKLNSRGSLDPKVSFSYSLSLPFLTLFRSEKGLLLPMEQEELQRFHNLPFNEKRKDNKQIR